MGCKLAENTSPYGNTVNAFQQVSNTQRDRNFMSSPDHIRFA